MILQPGVAFGTGEHPTTRLCLLALEAMALKGKTIIDYGTGVGHKVGGELWALLGGLEIQSNELMMDHQCIRAAMV